MKPMHIDFIKLDFSSDTNSTLQQFCEKYGMEYTSGISTSWACIKKDIDGKSELV